MATGGRGGCRGRRPEIEAPQWPTVEEPTEEPAEEPTEEPAGEPAEKPIEEPEEHAEEPTEEEKAEEPIEEPAVEPTEEPAEEPTEEPIEEPIEQEPTDWPEQEPTEERTEEPAEQEPTNWPVQEPDPEDYPMDPEVECSGAYPTEPSDPPAVTDRPPTVPPTPEEKPGCPEGAVIRDGRCQTVCPEGAVPRDGRCQMAQRSPFGSRIGQWGNPDRPQNTIISASRNQPGTASSTGSAIVPLLNSILKLDSRPRVRHDGLWTSTSGQGASAMARGGGSWSPSTGGDGGAWASAGGGLGGRGLRWPAVGGGWGHTGHSSWPFNRSPGRKHGHRGWGLVWTSRKFDFLVLCHWIGNEMCLIPRQVVNEQWRV